MAIVGRDGEEAASLLLLTSLCLAQPVTAATITPATAQGGDCDLRQRYRSVPHQDHWDRDRNF
jgi:hypothetical protein